MGMSRDVMAQTIMELVAGQETEPSFFAQADALASGVGGTAFQSGHSRDYALRYLDALHDGMRRFWVAVSAKSSRESFA